MARGDSTRRLALGRYLIKENGTQSTPSRNWQLTEVSCDGRLLPFQQGQVTVELTSENPDQTCQFINAFATPPLEIEPPTPTPTPSPGPGPSPTPAAPLPAPRPELVLAKRALRSSVRLGQTVGYLITVRNTGAGTADDVVVADRPGPNAQLVSAHPSQGSCDQRTPTMICRLGTIEPGGHATIRVRVRATGTPLMDNLAVLGSGTLERALSNNVAHARVRVRVLDVLGRCVSASAASAPAGPIARIAC